MIVLSIVVGIILGALIIMFSSLQLRYENRRLNKKLHAVEQEIESLRVLPLNDSH